MQINITIDDRIIHLIKRSKLAIVTVSLFLIGAAALYASTSLQWTDFQPGDVISASELNKRFNASARGGIDGDGTYVYEMVNGELKKVYTTNFTGTMPDSLGVFKLNSSSFSDVDWRTRNVLSASIKLDNLLASWQDAAVC